ncbi:single-stranded DNA-binding protein [uncultured Jatrophihabitans sp.]|uniref:single-stranded DNA-binding protein n=1 Tax=uncultured Jatrophihabitans sp. TaxID=1610747 RepID=UPI0035CB1BC1
MSATTAADDGDNRIFLRGKLAGPPLLRDLPSGDVLAVFRLTVARPPGEQVRVDSLECASTKPRVLRVLTRAAVGDTLEVDGSLRRRFWRAPTGPASRYSVDAASVRIKKADRRGGASPSRTPASA